MGKELKLIDVLAPSMLKAIDGGCNEDGMATDTGDFECKLLEIAEDLGTIIGQTCADPYRLVGMITLSMSDAAIYAIREHSK